MPLPAFRADGWLPEGHHKATWEEITERFGGDASSDKRLQVARRFFAWRDACRAAGLSGTLVVNGSFISQKSEPGDIDCIFVYAPACAEVLKRSEAARILVDYQSCKAAGIGDIFVFPQTAVDAYPEFCRLDGFDLHKLTGKPKGVVEVAL